MIKKNFFSLLLLLIPLSVSNKIRSEDKIQYTIVEGFVVKEWDVLYTILGGIRLLKGVIFYFDEGYNN